MMKLADDEADGAGDARHPSAPAPTANPLVRGSLADG
jgi:hypothetical protein